MYHFRKVRYNAVIKKYCSFIEGGMEILQTGLKFLKVGAQVALALVCGPAVVSILDISSTED